MCRLVAKGSKSHFCGQTCSDRAERNGPMLLEIPAGHDTFKDGRCYYIGCTIQFDLKLLSVAHQFKVSWRHTSKVPHVRRVYKIIPSASSLAKYNAYRYVIWGIPLDIGV
jgi:hypothetical protein